MAQTIYTVSNAYESWKTEADSYEDAVLKFMDGADFEDIHGPDDYWIESEVEAAGFCDIDLEQHWSFHVATPKDDDAGDGQRVYLHVDTCH